MDEATEANLENRNQAVLVFRYFVQMTVKWDRNNTIDLPKLVEVLSPVWQAQRTRNWCAIDVVHGQVRCKAGRADLSPKRVRREFSTLQLQTCIFGVSMVVRSYSPS